MEALFDSLSDYTIGTLYCLFLTSGRNSNVIFLFSFSGPQSRDVTVFLDSMCLGSGRRFDTEFVRAMMNTSIAMPVVSLDSFFVLTTHDVSTTRLICFKVHP